MIQQLLPAHPFLFVDYQCSLKKILCFLSNFYMKGKCQWSCGESLFVVIDASDWPGSRSIDEFIKHQAQTPNIALGSVWFLPEKLRCHVDGSSTNLIKFLFAKDISPAGKAEIPDLIMPIFEEDILRFDVAMDIGRLDEDAEPFDDIIENIDTLHFL